MQSKHKPSNCPHREDENTFGYTECMPSGGVQSKLSESQEKRFEDEIYIPHEIIDGDSCFNYTKKPIYQDDTGGRRIIGYEKYGDDECRCGMKKVKQEIKQFLASELSLQKEETRLEVYEDAYQSAKLHLIKEIEKKKELHTHNSIPCYTGDEDGKCIICVKNVILDDVLASLKK